MHWDVCGSLLGDGVGGSLNWATGSPLPARWKDNLWLCRFRFLGSSSPSWIWPDSTKTTCYVNNHILFLDWTEVPVPRLSFGFPIASNTTESLHHSRFTWLAVPRRMTPRNEGPWLVESHHHGKQRWPADKARIYHLGYDEVQRSCSPGDGQVAPVSAEAAEAQINNVESNIRKFQHSCWARRSLYDHSLPPSSSRLMNCVPQQADT